jgi:hypothetical protein
MVLGPLRAQDQPLSFPSHLNSASSADLAGLKQLGCRSLAASVVKRLLS